MNLYNQCTLEGNYLVLPNGKRIINCLPAREWLDSLERMWRENKSEFTAELLEAVGFQADFTPTDQEPGQPE